jgi:hypothetical protein
VPSSHEEPSRELQPPSPLLSEKDEVTSTVSTDSTTPGSVAHQTRTRTGTREKELKEDETYGGGSNTDMLILYTPLPTRHAATVRLAKCPRLAPVIAVAR